jgi:Ca2+-binding RTX toxin-like protein
MIAGRGGQDVISGGRGAQDTVSYQWMPRPGLRVRVAFRAFARGTEFLSGIEDVIGSRWEDDTIHGGDVRNILRGMAGADFVIGGSARDHLYGGPGDDTVDGHDGMPGDVVHGGVGLDVCHADVGDLVRSCEVARQ